MIRTAREIVSQAIVYGALGFRASLEVTVHPRSIEISSRLLPWLDELGLADQIEPLYREILETVHGRLSPRDRTEAYWCGEGAAVFGWVVQIFDAPDPALPIDPAQLVDRLHLLKPAVTNLLTEATLRATPEIDEFCAFCLAVRTQYQKLSMPEDIALTLDHILRKRVDELGLPDADRAITEASAFAARTTPPPRGLYVIRAMAAEWLLDAHGESHCDP